MEHSRHRFGASAAVRAPGGDPLRGAGPAAGAVAPSLEGPPGAAPAGAAAPALCEVSLHEIGKSFGRVPVLRGVTLTVPGGDFVTILGPSGCGKTTLLRIVAGLELPDRGRVLLSGRDVTAEPANRRPVNTVFQSYALFPHLTVWENIAFGLKARRFPRGEIARRVEGAVEMLHLESFPSRHPHQLSGGERQRVALARALVNEPDVLLLDEPLSSLDAKLRAEVQLELRALQRRLGKTFILVTHDQGEAMSVSDRIFVMRDGRIVQSGPPAEVYDHPANRFVAEFLGSTNLIPASRFNGHCRTDLGPLVPRCKPAWESGLLAIRPERLRLHSGRPARNGLQAVVSEVVYRGDHLDVFVQPGALRLRLPTGNGSAGLAPGGSVWIELPSEHLEPLVD